MKKKLLHSFLVASRLIFVFIILIGAFVFAMFQGGVVSWTIFYAIVPFALYSILLFFYPLSSFTINRHVNKSHLYVDDQLEVELTMRRKVPFPLLYLVVEDEWFIEETGQKVAKDKRLLLVGFKKEMQWTYTIERLTRGEAVAKNVTVTAIDFFGWLKKMKVIQTRKNKILVLPKIVKVDYQPLETEHVGGSAISHFNYLKDTNVISSVRDYEQGDRMSWIHWKSFARTTKLMTKEFEDHGSKELHVVFDNRPSSMFEAEVSLTASILQAIHQERNPVQFASAFDETSFLTIQTEDELRVVLTYLAKVQPTKSNQALSPSFFENKFNREGAIVVVTARIDQVLVDLLTTDLARGRTVISFVVINHREAPSSHIREEIKVAQQRGILVQTIQDNRLSDVFQEVMPR